MFRTIGKLMIGMMLVIGSMAVGALFSYHGSPGTSDLSLAQSAQDIPAAPPTQMSVEMQSRRVILASVTPLPTATATLLPPPTFEPPTSTPVPTLVPSVTPTSVSEVNVSIPGLQGLETPTPTTTPGCEPRKDWKLTYTVQFDDALSRIADKYGIWVDDLAAANCITDKNMITVGQVLRVPGDAQPVEQISCDAWEALTPFNGMFTVPADGTITFNWRGPESPKSLLRIFRPDGTTYEQLVELRQNATVDLTESLPDEGQYTWYVYPLGNDFKQIQCLEGGPWIFHKNESEPTPTPSASGGFGG